MTSRDDDLVSIEHHLALLLRRSRGFLVGAAQAVHPDLEPQAYGLLVRLDEVGTARPSDLAAFFGVGKPTLGRQLTVLEDLGLVERQPNPSDARSMLVALTREGAKRLRKVRDQGRERFRDSFQEWADLEVGELATSLKRLNERTQWE